MAEEKIESEEANKDKEQPPEDLSAPPEEPQKPPPGHVPIRALQDERTKRQALQEQLEVERQARARLEGELKGRTPQPTTAAAPVITHKDVLKAYKAGQISEEEKDEALFLLSKEQGKAEAVRAVEETNKREAARTTAQQDIHGYVQALPALADRTSQEFSDVIAEYQRLLQMGYPDSEATQRVAFRSTFGPLDKLKARKVVQGTSAEPETFSELGGGGRSAGKNADPLKHIPKWQIDQWHQWNYTREQMVAEAKYFREHRRGGRT